MECEETLDANSTSVLCNNGPINFALAASIMNTLDPTGCFNAVLPGSAIQLWDHKDGTPTTRAQHGSYLVLIDLLEQSVGH